MSVELPTPTQTLLLRACLLDGDAQREALERFRRAVDLDDVDAGSHRLLPMLYRRLVETGRDDPDLGRLRGTHRKAWYQNLVLRTQAEGILRLLHEAGVDTVVLKGCGLHTTVYRPEPALRPLEDIDLLVREAHLTLALETVRSAGFAYLPGQVYGEAWARYLHAGGYGRGPQEAVDLHRRPLRFQLDPGYTERVWDRVVAVRFGDVATHTLDPTDHLLTAMVHGLAPNPVPPCRWVADATLLVRAGGIDWDRLVADAAAIGGAQRVAAGIAYLGAEIDVAVPAGVVERLRSAPVTRLARRLERLNMQPASRRVLLARALVEDYAMVAVDRGWRRAVAGYPGYVRARFYRGVAGTVRRLGRIVRQGPGAAP